MDLVVMYFIGDRTSLFLHMCNVIITSYQKENTPGSIEEEKEGEIEETAQACSVKIYSPKKERRGDKRRGEELYG